MLTGRASRRVGEFEYKPWYHGTGPVKVLDWQAPEHPQAAGDGTATRDARYLAHQPATARRICTKLAQYFVAETPVERRWSTRMVATYLANDTAIAPVLRTMFRPPSSAPARAP